MNLLSLSDFSLLFYFSLAESLPLSRVVYLAYLSNIGYDTQIAELNIDSSATEHLSCVTVWTKVTA